jgi:RNA polymerase sigma-70 factor (ECF subfamily)
LLLVNHSRIGDLFSVTDYPPESDESDDVLMRAVATGDQQAFRRFVERHQSLVIGTVARMLGAGDAEDIAQQVFLNVWKSAPRWRPEAKVTTWLMTITKRLVFNESRRRSRSRILPRQREDDPSPEIPGATPSPDREILERELHEAIGKAMTLLPAKERMAVVLRRYEGMAYEEIASVLGTTVPAVKSLLFRARNTLREKLGPYLKG